ncbi:hypothetical protein ANCCAN_25994 [Ancylostoma caninum]|uniref:Mitochondrial inner membrane protease subunit 2 n=1 Tax=Ancylostoma caninum TaxID=29170 RepID=A0A368FBR1_ANCCA|nr:hypothetical protein ANCCAN_25994 [Ancylostoma caninum]
MLVGGIETSFGSLHGVHTSQELEMSLHSCESPREPDKIHIKRVTAVEGDLVRPKHRNELLLVPKGCCWMESDNPVNANDSNIYGPVSRGLMKNRATHVIWPPSRWQRL